LAHFGFQVGFDKFLHFHHVFGTILASGARIGGTQLEQDETFQFSRRGFVSVGGVAAGAKRESVVAGMELDAVVGDPSCESAREIGRETGTRLARK
jgi:hypothetical protein